MVGKLVENGTGMKRKTGPSDHDDLSAKRCKELDLISGIEKPLRGVHVEGKEMMCDME